MSKPLTDSTGPWSRYGTVWRRTVVVEAMPAPPSRRTVVRLACGHIAFRQYHMSVGMRAYCAPCARADLP